MTQSALAARRPHHVLPAPRILVVDDKPIVTKSLKQMLETLDWGSGTAQVIGTHTPDAFRASFSALNPDIVVVDLRLTPPFDSTDEGKDLIAWVADSNTMAGIIVHTDQPESVDAPDCLAIGADDYITKPANTGMIEERVRAVWRRVHLVRSRRDSLGNSHVFDIGGWRYFPAERNVTTPNGISYRLTLSEHQLIEHLIRAEGHIITPGAFNIFVLERNAEAADRRLDNIVYRLRKKLGDAFPIRNVTGTGGYALTELRLAE